jgi:hypothetical protein
VTQEHSASVRDMQAWITRMERTGEMNPNTVKAWGYAVPKVLEVMDVENVDDVDLRSVDIDDLLRRFEVKNRLKYTASSLETYRSRFRQSVLMFIAYIDGDKNWRNAARPAAAEGQARPPRKRSTPKPKESQSPPQPASVPPVTPPTSSGSSLGEPSGGPGFVSFPVVLRGGKVTASFSVPLDLTIQEAEGLAEVIKAVAFASAASSAASPNAAAASKEGDKR